jgi:pimeloyl-ACP methyl ester carboxylesterase
VLKAAEATMKITTAGLAVQAGLGLDGAHALSQSNASDTALAHRGNNKTTERHPGIDQKGLPHPSNQTDLERNLSKVTPELLEHLGTFVKNPEQFIRNVQKRDHNLQKRDQKREQRQEMRRLVEEAREHPEVLESLRKLFEEMPEQKSSETSRIKRDLGTERLTPEKVPPEVWESVRKMLTERRELNDNTGTTVVLVHGFEISPAGVIYSGAQEGANCNDGYWGDAIKFLAENGFHNVQTVGFYSGDQNCDVDLHDAAFQNRCIAYSAGSEGSLNEDIAHISCLLAQYLNQNFAGQNVILVGHSMGGIIVRNMMYQVQEQAGLYDMPSDIGKVTHAVTFNSPHAGVADVANVGCGGCTQLRELQGSSDFMQNLVQNAQNPQLPGTNTEWTVVGSECDQWLGLGINPDGPATAIAMDANHAIMYSKENSASSGICYDHGSGLHDSGPTENAILYRCDRIGLVPCGTDYQNQDATVTNWKRTTTGARGLTALDEAVER